MFLKLAGVLVVGAATLLSTGVQAASASPASTSTSLKAGSSVGRQEVFKYLRSPDSKVVFSLDRNGVLTVMHNGNTTWSSRSKNVSGATAYIDPAGHLGIYPPNSMTPVWSSQTDGRVADKGGAVILQVQNDGNVVMYNADGGYTWSTNTHGK